MITILIVTILISSILCFWFYQKTKSIKYRHHLTLQDINNQINLSKKQILKRQNHLKNYHFLKYNLTEALVVQSAINL